MVCARTPASHQKDWESPKITILLKQWVIDAFSSCNALQSGADGTRLFNWFKEVVQPSCDKWPATDRTRNSNYKPPVEWGRCFWLASCHSRLRVTTRTNSNKTRVWRLWPLELPWEVAFGGNGHCLCFLILRDIAWIYSIHPLHDFLWTHFAEMITLHALCFYIHHKISHLYPDLYIVVRVCTKLWFPLTISTLIFALSQIVGGHVHLFAIYCTHSTVNTKPTKPTLKPWVLYKCIFHLHNVLTQP